MMNYPHYNADSQFMEDSRAKHAGVTYLEVAAIIALATTIVLLLLPWARWSTIRQRNACAENLKEMGSIFALYASESPGNRYPLKSPHSSSPDIAVLYPDYMNDLQPLICPEMEDFSIHTESNPEHWYNEDGTPQLETLRREADGSYAYFGFAIPNNAWLVPVGFIRPLLEQAFATLDEDADWTNHPSPDVQNATLYRLHTGVEQVLAKEGHLAETVPGGVSRLAVMWDNLSTPLNPTAMAPGVQVSLSILNHDPGGSNVLFLDGHVEFVEYSSGRFPVTEEYASISFGGFRSASTND